MKTAEEKACEGIPITEKIELTIEQLRIINHIMFHVVHDYPGTIQNSMRINKDDMKTIGQIRHKIRKALMI